LIYVKVYRRGAEVLVAACDEGLLGRKFREGDLVLWAKESFYRGDLVTKGELVTLLKGCTIANLLGEEAVEAGIEAGVVDEENVIVVQGIPHAQFALL